MTLVESPGRGQRRGGAFPAARAIDMAKTRIDFDAPDLAARAERASLFELDHLPFGVIRLDREGTVQFYNSTEARLSGYGDIPIGENLFAISNCLGSEGFRGRLERAMADGPVDLEIGWLINQIADVLEKALIAVGIVGHRPVFAVPAVDLALQLVAKHQQPPILRHEIGDEARKTTPEPLGVEPRSGHRFMFNKGS